VITAVVLSVFVLIGNPLIVLVIMGVLGYRKRVGFLAGLTVSQISEFSLILAALGVSLGFIDDRALALVTAVGLMTISASTYAILYSHQLYEWLEPWLSIFERKRQVYAGESQLDEELPLDVVVCGLGRFGRRLADELQRSGHRVLGVDFDPRAVESWAETGHPAVYGDLEDPEFAATLPLDRVRWVVSSVPGRDANLAMIHALGEQGYRGRIAATAHYEEDAEQLRRRGATEVFNPFAVAAERAVATLQRDD